MDDVTTRRALLGAGALLAAGSLARSLRAEDEAPGPAPAGATPERAKPLKLLILGGTRFLGPAIVDAALARGHTVTLFNRGKSNPGMYPRLEKLRGNRGSHGDARRGRKPQPVDLASLKGRQWDAAIDTSGYWPEFVEVSAKQLATQVAHYVFISSISVYPAFGKKAGTITEASSLGDLKPRAAYQGFDYGAFKALSEQACEAAMPGRVANVRPGLIVGARDGTRRFGEWGLKVRRGGEILAPGDPEGHCQFIDVKDLGAWCVHLTEQRTAGVFNATGFPGHLSFQEFLHGSKCAIRTDCSFTWVEEAFLEKQKIQPWLELPNWMPAARLSWVAPEKAIAAGLTFRPVADTIQDALAWDLAQREKAGTAWKERLSPEKERAVLRAWHARKKPAPAGPPGAGAK